MKKTLSLLLALVLALSLFAGTASAAPTKMQRDLQSCRSMGGHIAQLDDLLYYFSDGYLRSMQLDGKGKKKLCKVEEGHQLTVYGGQLYFLGDSGEDSETGSLYSYKPGATKSKLVFKEVDLFVISKGIVYHTTVPGGKVYSYDLKTRKKATVYETQFYGIEGLDFVQGMLVILDRPLEDEDALVFLNPATGKYAMIRGDYEDAFVNAHGDSIYVQGNNRNLEEFSFNAATPSVKKVRTLRSNVDAFIVSGDYLYIVEEDEDGDFETVYKRSIATGKETVYIKDIDIAGDSRNDTTFEPMGDRIWRFNWLGEEQTLTLIGSRAK